MFCFSEVGVFFDNFFDKQVVCFIIEKHVQLLRSCIFDFSELGVFASESLSLVTFPSSTCTLLSSAFELDPAPSSTKNERTCQSNGFSTQSHRPSCRKVRSSATSAGNPTSLGLDDLTLRQEELRDSLETLLLSHLCVFFLSSSERTFS